jgi:hypothetical protein
LLLGQALRCLLLLLLVVVMLLLVVVMLLLVLLPPLLQVVQHAHCSDTRMLQQPAREWQHLQGVSLAPAAALLSPQQAALLAGCPPPI